MSRVTRRHSLSTVLIVAVNCRLDWPVRTLSFSYDGRMLASASEDLLIDIADVDTGDMCSLVTDRHCDYAIFHSDRCFRLDTGDMCSLVTDRHCDYAIFHSDRCFRLDTGDMCSLVTDRHCDYAIFHSDRCFRLHILHYSLLN